MTLPSRTIAREEEPLDLGLDGARALVGGGSSGLGLAVGTVLAGEGARVALAARPSERLDAASGAVERSVAIGVDLESVDGPASAVQRAIEALGGLDVVLVNSGGPPPGSFDDLDEATWDKAIQGTLLGAVRLIRAALPHLRHSDRPAILVILSSSAREPIPGLTASNTIRPGLAGLIKTLSAEIAPIRINGLAPGRFTTPRNTEVEEKTAARTGQSTDEVRAGTVARIPLGRLGDPMELGRVGAFLLSPAASFVTGAIIPVDGGMVKSLP
jgi:3-oxoacyl-[acyl-carrier protein] reductase